MSYPSVGGRRWWDATANTDVVAPARCGTAGATLNIKEKVDIGIQLSRLGVDICEAGFPIASQVGLGSGSGSGLGLGLGLGPGSGTGHVAGGGDAHLVSSGDRAPPVTAPG